MSRRLRIQTPPPSGNAQLDLWLRQATDALNQLPNISLSSTTNGPESAVSADSGTILIDLGSSATTFWAKVSGVSSSGWTPFQL